MWFSLHVPPGSIRSRMVCMTIAMAIPMAPSAVLAAKTPTVTYSMPSPTLVAGQASSGDGPAQSATEFLSSPQESAGEATQPAPAVVDVAAVLQSEPVQRVGDRLQKTGFMIYAVPLGVAAIDNGRTSVLFGIDEAGGPKTHDPDDALWTDSFRVGVVAVVDNNQSVVSTTEIRLTQDGAGNTCLLWQTEMASDPGTLVRVVDRYVDGEPQREVEIREMDASGILTVAAGGPMTDSHWRCIRNCLLDEGIRLGIIAATCILICLIVAGLAVIIGGGAAGVAVLTSCLSSCKRSVLSAFLETPGRITSCVSDCF